MLKFVCLLSALLVAVSGSGEIIFLSQPKSVTFKGHDSVKESDLPEVFSASMGFSIEKNSNWAGLYLKDPFNLANGFVTVALDGVSNIDFDKGHLFPLHTDEDESEVYNTLVRRMEEHNYGETSQLVRIELAKGIDALSNYENFQSIKKVKPMKSLYGNLKEPVDETFLLEMAMLNAIADKFASGSIAPSSTPDLYWFKVSGLHAISDFHGQNSTATKEAKAILGEVLRSLNRAVKKAYRDRALVTVLSSDASHTRRTRAANADIILNLAAIYSSDYPVIFNIILWFGIAMFFSLLAICLFIASMDPGRDSIIYRMTSTRMKKDN